jgi:hypothetical protein
VTPPRPVRVIYICRQTPCHLAFVVLLDTILVLPPPGGGPSRERARFWSLLHVKFLGPLRAALDIFAGRSPIGPGRATVLRQPRPACGHEEAGGETSKEGLRLNNRAGRKKVKGRRPRNACTVAVRQSHAKGSRRPSWAILARLVGRLEQLVLRRPNQLTICHG